MKLRLASVVAAASLLGACASPMVSGPPAKETLFAVTADQRLLKFNGGQPEKPMATMRLTGLAAGERVLGIDFRVARGQLFALGSSGRLYRVDTTSGAATAVGEPFAVALQGTEFGFDFNPTVNRIRVVGNQGQNLRLHPDTGAVVDGNADQPGVQTDGMLAYDAADPAAGRRPAVVAAAYTYNKDNDKITTNFAIDAAAGTLVTQGSREGVQPVVSPNSGRLFTVGSLGVGPIERANFDISDIGNVAYATITAPGATQATLYRLNLTTGAATRVGVVAAGEAITGIAIEP
ncbi:DUF4394 domain-containing protein [Aquabacterium sp. J223]|uniref:DUF4394 domain-containing protein n=1 Tax=Aquabacterium sp. J223 TaxID=2898431 RepID=UPI0021AD7CA1|nr:DUF4394 domain-containing protein [Aquabacterium sp. J223]UUX94037.1 DUF4394 domain-containing protein [Aquabacterium sp. J223]